MGGGRVVKCDVEGLCSGGGAMHVILLLFCGKSSRDSLARFFCFVFSLPPLPSPSYLANRKMAFDSFWGWGGVAGGTAVSQDPLFLYVLCTLFFPSCCTSRSREAVSNILTS